MSGSKYLIHKEKSLTRKFLFSETQKQKQKVSGSRHLIHRKFTHKKKKKNNKSKTKITNKFKQTSHAVDTNI